MVAAMTEAVLPELQPEGRYLVRWFDPVGLGAVPFGLVLELARQGASVGVDEQFGPGALPRRASSTKQPPMGCCTCVLGGRIDDVAATPGVVRVADVDLRTAAEVARAIELEAFLLLRFDEIGRPELAERLDSQYGRAGMLFIVPPLPADVADAVSELVALRLPAAVFLAPPGTEIAAIA